MQRWHKLAFHAFLAAAVFLCAFGMDAFAQSSSISSPEMPVITSPSLGSGFYNPFAGRTGFYQGQKKDDRIGVASVEKKSESRKSDSAEIKKVLGLVTASEISSLSSMGLLDLNGAGSIRGEGTQQALERVLAELNELKSSASIPREVPVTIVRNAPVVASETLSSAAQKAASKILRFNVNNYDILETCRKVYISDIQNDGSFLVTGDRLYSSDGKNRSETFHILFKSSAAESGNSNYSAAASVTQDYLNEYSFLYQLSNMKGLSAVRTGNLVTMRTTDPAWKLDLLIDLGEK